MMINLITILGVGGMLAAAVPAAAQSPDLIAKGEAVYAANKCSMCHSIDGKGQAKGPLDDVGSRLKADEIREWIVNPATMSKLHNATRKPPMRAYPKMAKDDLDALVAYMSSLKKK